MITRSQLGGLGVGVVAIGAAIASLAGGGSAVDAAKALLAGALAGAIGWLVTTLPGLTLRGFVMGGAFVLAGIISWTLLDKGWAVWVVLLASCVAYAVWAWPWPRGFAALLRLGTSWLGLAYWILGAVGALLVLHPGVAGQRVLYGGGFGLAALAVVASVRRPGGRDLSVGMAGAFLTAAALLLLAGSGTLFSGTHAVPPGLWGVHMEHRFWGGEWFLYHPNSLAVLVVAAGSRIGVDRAFAVWQRIAVTALAGFVVLETNSRTGFLFLGATAAVHAVLLWRRRGEGLPDYRRWWVAAAVPFAVLALVLVLSGGKGFLVQARYGGDDPTSGRLDTWKQVGVEWQHAGWAEKLFGDAQTARAVVVRTNDGAAPGQAHLKLNTDNAAVGAFRRGGVLGALAFLLGLALLLWHAWFGPRTRGRLVDQADAATRRAPPAWFTVAAFGSLATIPTADHLLGGTNGTLWILLLAGEVWLLFRPGAGQPTATLSMSGAHEVELPN